MTVMQTIQKPTCSNLRSPGRQRAIVAYFEHDASQGLRSIVELPSESFSYAPWLRKFQEELYVLAELGDGWDSYDAPAPSRNAIAAASDFLNFLPSSKRIPIHVGPTVSGGVGFTLVNEDGTREVAIEFKNHGHVTLTRIDHATGGSLETKPFESSHYLATLLLEDLGQFLES